MLHKTKQTNKQQEKETIARMKVLIALANPLPSERKTDRHGQHRTEGRDRQGKRPTERNRQRDRR